MLLFKKTEVLVLYKFFQVSLIFVGQVRQGVYPLESTRENLLGTNTLAFCYKPS
jgi:hypothetical protein